MPTIPRITDTPAQRIAFIHVTCKASEVQQVMGPGIGELISTVAAQGVKITGPWFTRHLRRPNDTFDFEIAVPVGAAVKAAGRVTPGELGAAKVAHTTYIGPYEGLGKAWGEFVRWIDSQGVKTLDQLWEVYVAGPESVKEPAQYRTELYRPIRD